MAESVMHRVSHRLTSLDISAVARSPGIYQKLRESEKQLSGFAEVLNNALVKQLTDVLVRPWLSDVSYWAHNLEDIIDMLATDYSIWRQLADLAFDFLRSRLEDERRLFEHKLGTSISWRRRLKDELGTDSLWSRLGDELGDDDFCVMLLIDLLDDDNWRRLKDKLPTDTLRKLLKDELPIDTLRSPCEDDLAAVYFLRSPLKDNLSTASSSTGPVGATDTEIVSAFVKYGYPPSKTLDQYDSDIEVVQKRFEALVEDISRLGLNEIAAGRTTFKLDVGSTSLFVDEPAVYGRDEDKAKILKMVLENNNRPADVNTGVILIVGEGGIGKTTVAQLVYNEPAVLKRFDTRAWVCVTSDFNVSKVSKNILSSFTASACPANDLEEVQIQLKEEVAGKRFLLVLDDVWDYDCDLWKTFMTPFISGVPGSVIIVTTKVEKADLTSSTAVFHRLKLLSDDACWSLLSEQAAFKTRLVTPDAIRSASIRKKIVKRCKGLPLAAKTLGGILRHIWLDDSLEDVLDSNLWDSSESSVLPVLWLSYYHLPLGLRPCFAYTSIFPKGYEFKEDEIVSLWMAEGLIWETENEQVEDIGRFPDLFSRSIFRRRRRRQRQRQVEDIGREYFLDLLSRSIFQPSSTDRSKFIMHDLVNDLAQRVSGETSFRLMDASDVCKQASSLQRMRHFSYISGNSDNKSTFEVLQEVDSLRTFLPIGVGASTRYVSTTVLSDLLRKLKKLRVLSLREYYITDLPASIEVLRLLRYLDASGTEIRHLPETTSLLVNLQTLLLRYCFCLKELPSGIGNLIKLRHLDIVGVSLREMPLGMRKLKDLQILSNFIVGKGTGLCIQDLGGFNLRGELHISGLENVTDIPARPLIYDKDLEVLVLEWVSSFDGSRNEKAEYGVLLALQPHENLKELTVKGYGGSKFPSWIAESFLNIVDLRLESCEQCTLLPALESLPELKNLSIKGMKGIKNICFYTCFRSLETLCLEDMQEWEHWDWGSIGENEFTANSFPRLLKLYILDCPKLSGRVPEHLPSLKQLVVHECAQLAVSISHFPSLEKLTVRECSELIVSFSSLRFLSELEINGCKRMECGGVVDLKNLKSVTLSNISELTGEAVHGFWKVEHLRIVNCEQLIVLWQNEMHHMTPPQPFRTFPSLMRLARPPKAYHTFTLTVEDCPTLTSFPLVSFFSNLRELLIVNCGALKSLLEGIKHDDCHIESLQIEGCHSLRCIVGGHLPSSLKHLLVTNCEGLNCLWGNVKDTSSSSVVHKKEKSTIFLSHLEKLYISNCPSLLSLSSSGELPDTLKQLEIQDCSGIRTLSRGQLPEALQRLEISGCLELMTLSTSGQLPKGLQHVDITDCPKLEAIAESSSYNMSLGFILIRDCKVLKSISKGLHDFTRLAEIYITDCPNLVCFPGGLLDTSLRVLSIQRCKGIKALPDCMPGLNSLRRLLIWQCSGIIHIPEGGFPENLTSLSIADLNICEPLFEWRLQRLTALTQLHIRGCQDVTSFQQEDKGMVLPISLTQLTIQGFHNLKYLSSDGFQSLSSLVNLSISDCPNLTFFPNEGLPSSLLQLYISDCPMLEGKCRKDGGSEWSKIAHIPRVTVDTN